VYELQYILDQMPGGARFAARQGLLGARARGGAERPRRMERSGNNHGELEQVYDGEQPDNLLALPECPRSKIQDSRFTSVIAEGLMPLGSLGFTTLDSI
jgi:hypothetical protein